MSRLTQRIILAFVMILVAATIALWQYSKYRSGYGIYRILSPEYGHYYIAFVFVVMVIIGVYVACIEKLD